MNIKFKVDKTKCIGCGLCVKDCLSRVLTLDENKNPQVIEEREKNCIKCQHCFAVCPTGAISILDKYPENSVETKEYFNSEELLEIIKERRSTRFYKKQNIDKNEINKLKNMLNYVPTGVNNHNLRFLFVEDISVMDKIREKVSDTLISLMPKNKYLQKKFSRYLKPLMDGEDVIFRGAPHMVVVLTPKKAPCKDIDPIIALSYFELYAKTLGISTCWCGLGYSCFKFIPTIRDLLNIPKTHEVGYVMLFGYSEFNYKREIQPEAYYMETISEVKDKKASFFSRIFKR